MNGGNGGECADGAGRPAAAEAPIEASLAGQVDRVCDAFEAAWRRGPPPRLEDFLSDLPADAIERAFGELLELELAYRRRAGQSLQLAELRGRFPELANEVEAAFARQPAIRDETLPAVKDSTTEVIPVERGAGGIADAATQYAPAPGETAGDPRASDATQQWQGGRAGPFIAPLAAVGSSSSSGSRFRVLRAFAKGGLGEVLVAEDSELHREVALKQIQNHYADDLESRSRFVMEAEITGRLEHPGIVPVYGLGAYADGRPFYAMRFIQGDSLKAAIDQFHARRRKGANVRELALDFRKLLGRFVDVCDAIEYAHSRGILHRDLKPANVMLGPYGETLVVDWGLAKAIGRPDRAVPSSESSLKPRSMGESAPTQMGMVVGTPQYMSPEQAAGRTDLIGPKSDVYGLGATLYCLLTGRPPIVGEGIELQEILDRVEAGDIPPAKQVEPWVAKPLEAICRMAMAVKPADRYASARALADDLEHWLADEPIAAQPDRAGERIARAIRRHRAGAMATATTLLIISIVSTIAVVRVNRQRQIADRLAVEKSELAARETRAKNEANLSFHQARDAVDDLFTDVSEDTLLNQPGMQSLRKELLRKTLDYYELFLAQRADDPSVKIEFGATLFRAGRNIDELESESAAKAIGYLERADKIQRELLDEAPGDRARLKALGDTDNEYGRALQLDSRYDEALRAYGSAVDLRRQLCDRAPGEKGFQRALANSIMNIGLVKRRLGDLSAAARQLTLSQDIRQKQLADGRENPKLERDLAMCYFNQGMIETEQKQSDVAGRDFSKSIEVFARLSHRSPRDLTLQYLLATAQRMAGGVKIVDKEPEEAARLYESARDGFARLAERNPDVSEYQKSLADVLLNLARQQETPAALSGLERAQSILRSLVEKNPRSPLFRRDLAEVLRVLASLERKANLPQIARKNLSEAITILTQLTSESPEKKEFAEALARSKRDWNEAYGGIDETRTL